MLQNLFNFCFDIVLKLFFSEVSCDGQLIIGMVFFGCFKVLVDSECILICLWVEGYQISFDYVGVDVVIVNICGFFDSVKVESFDVIGEVLVENGKVIVIGCLGVELDYICEYYFNILVVMGLY